MKTVFYIYVVINKKKYVNDVILIYSVHTRVIYKDLSLLCIFS